ncbi:MAG: hypothetical protein RLY30_9 [Pseudomonadota bacterium]
MSVPLNRFRSAHLLVCSVLVLLWPSPQAVAQGRPVGEPTPPVQGEEEGEQQVQEIQVRGRRLSDLDERRQSTAAKTIVGKEEIEKYGDSSLEDVLRRQPGVTVPSGGGNPRMRGLGGAYTQILIDGQPAGRGFSIDSISPDQVERLEITKSPTAETGAQAVAGSINIITRAGRQQSRRDLRAAVTGSESRREARAGLNHTGEWLGLDTNLSGGVFVRDQDSQSSSRVSEYPEGQEAALGGQDIDRNGESSRTGLSLRGRLGQEQGGGRSWFISPLFFGSRGDSSSRTRFSEWAGLASSTLATSDLRSSQSESDSQFYWSRLSLQMKRPVVEGLRLELDLNRTQMGSDSASRSLGQLVSGGQRETDEVSDMVERSSGLTAKLRREGEQHEQVFGLEWALAHRNEFRSELVNGVPSLLGTEENVSGRSERLSLYAQNEWNPSPRWTLMTGVRQERIETSGGSVGSEALTNTSEITTPLVHMVFRPVPKGPDLFRVGLTRGYKAANLRDFIAAPNISDRFPVQGANSFTSPDRAGNPGLKPELALGLDVAFERSLPQRGLLSVAIFGRELTDFQARQTLLEQVSWSPVARWVSRLRNLGSAQTHGIELEARVAAPLLGLQWPGAEIRSSLSAYRSSVEAIPGPNNRLDQQPGLTAKLGAEQRLGAGGQWGANLAYTQGGRVQVSEESWSRSRNQLRLDAFWLTRITQTMRVRISGQDLLSWGSRSETGTVIDGVELRSFQANAGEARITIGVEGVL